MFKPVVDNVYMVSANDSGRFPSSFCFYIEDDKKALLDTPLDPGITRYFKHRPVDMILNTHFHRDHAGCNHLFPTASIYAHALDAPAMTSFDTFCQYYGISQYGNEAVKDYLLNRLRFTPSPIEGTFADGDVINLGKIRLETIHTPGHTPGHCVFYWREKQILFAGDIDLTRFGPWYGNYNSDVTAFIHSIEKVMALKPRVILSGHKGIITENVQARLRAYLNRIYENEICILEALQTPLTLEALTERKIIYRHWHLSVNRFFEKVSLVVHLRRLMQLGQVTYHDNYYQAADNQQYFLCSSFRP